MTAPSETDAYQTGKRKGRANSSLDANPHKPGSAERFEWLIGWHEGNAIKARPKRKAACMAAAATYRAMLSKLKPKKETSP